MECKTIEVAKLQLQLISNKCQIDLQEIIRMFKIQISLVLTNTRLKCSRSRSLYPSISSRAHKMKAQRAIILEASKVMEHLGRLALIWSL